MEPLEFFLGMATFQLAVRFKKPLRKAAVAAASQAFTLVDRLKTTAYGLKEEIEDIVAEAHYENMKKNMPLSQEMETKPLEEKPH
ncbi:MAG: hypothetical protein N2484_17210 [Clostridia bacterium]|nr:hypothetical protein [Clostridia bacterium]